MNRLPSMARSMVPLCCGIALIAASCGDGSDDASALVATESTTTSAAPTTVAPTTAPTTTAPSTTQPATTTGPDLAPVDDSTGFELYDRRYFVYDVVEDDTLNVRSAAGASSDIVAELAPDTGGIAVYSPAEFVGDDQWLPIAYDGQIGWVAGRFLRPEPSVATPEEQGTPTDVFRDLGQATVDGLSNQTALATLVGDAGLLISLDGFVDSDDITLSVADLEDPTAEVRTWGFTDGVGDPIALNQSEMFAYLAGSTALTSTEAIGFNTIIGAGSTINNVADAFPGADVVEYHFAGTDFFAGLDWESVRFVYDGETLIAIVADHWTT